MDKITDWQSLITLSNTGLQVAPFIDIKKSLIEKYKEIYGSDIEISDSNADGIFINNVALMINNMLKSFSTFYANMDINTASGIYLDKLCALGNIYRSSETYSLAQLIVTNTGSTTISGTLQFSDVNGVTWTWLNENNETIEPNKSLSIIVTCDDAGPISAPAGSIINAINANISISIEQNEDADIGSYKESDEQLRARKKQYNLINVSTTTAGLYSSLLYIDGINDVYIYNNDSDQEKTLDDNANIQPHDIYVVIGKRDNVGINDKRIAQIIYNYLTPGIRSYFTGEITNGESKSYDYQIEGIGTKQKIYWKEITKVIPSSSNGIKITLSIDSNFTETSLSNIATAVANYMNQLSVYDIVKLKEQGSSDTKLRIAISNADSLGGYYLSNLSNFDTLLDSCDLSTFKFSGSYTKETSTTTLVTIIVY